MGHLLWNLWTTLPLNWPQIQVRLNSDKMKQLDVDVSPPAFVWNLTWRWSLDLNPVAKGSKITFFALVTLPFDLWPWPLRSTQTASGFYPHATFHDPISNSSRDLISGLVNFGLGLYKALENYVFRPGDLVLWSMTLTFKVNLGNIRVHPHAEFHDPHIWINHTTIVMVIAHKRATPFKSLCIMCLYMNPMR